MHSGTHVFSVDINIFAAAFFDRDNKAKSPRIAFHGAHQQVHLFRVSVLFLLDLYDLTGKFQLLQKVTELAVF